MTAIRTEHLTHAYSVGTPFQKVAVDNVSIAIEEGEPREKEMAASCWIGTRTPQRVSHWSPPGAEPPR